MSNRTFGRARVKETAAPEASSAWSNHWSIDAENRERWVVLLLCSPLVVLLVDSMFSGTELISPIGSGYLWWMRGLGLADGIALLFFMRNSAMFEKLSVIRKLLLVLIGPFLMAAAFDALAWRSANWIAFGASSASYESAQYPIMRVNMARKGRRATIAIDPLGTGEAAHIPIPRDQYRQLIRADGDQCVTVQQRRAANGAVQIRTDGEFTLKEPDYAVVTPC